METRRFSGSQLSGEDLQKGLTEVQGISQRFGEIRGDFWGQAQLPLPPSCRQGGGRPSRAPDCEPAPKRDPTSDLQLVDGLKEISFRVGSRSAPIGTPHVWRFLRRFQLLA